MPRNPARRAPVPGRLLLTAAALGLLFAACGTAAPELTALPGTQLSSPDAAEKRPAAPGIRVALFDGGVFDLTSHLSRDGRPVLLNLWASWCPPCREEMPHFEAAARRHPEVLFLGVAVQDDPVAAADTARELGVTYPVGADEDGAVDAAFPAPGLPATFLIGGDGTLIGVVYGGLRPGDIDRLLARDLRR